MGKFKFFKKKNSLIIDIKSALEKNKFSQITLWWKKEIVWPLYWQEEAQRALNKKYKKINNHPLISYSIYAALKSNILKNNCLSTQTKLEMLQIYGAEAPFKRPKILSGDKVWSVTALKHAVIETEKIYKRKFDYIIELPCVSPLRDHTDVDKAVEILIEKKYDLVISYVNTGEKHPTRLKRIKNNIVTNFCKDYPELILI